MLVSWITSTPIPLCLRDSIIGTNSEYVGREHNHTHRNGDIKGNFWIVITLLTQQVAIQFQLLAFAIQSKA